MKPNRTRFFSTLLCGSLLLAHSSWAGTNQDVDPTSGAGNQEAMAILDRMARFLSTAKRFRVTMRIRYDAVQASGQKIEFSELRKILISRPGYFRSDVEQSDGDSGFIVYDGKTIMVYNAAENVYARLEQSGSIDNIIRYLVGELGIRLPLARMWVTTVPTELRRGVVSVDHVERSSLSGVTTDHIAARSKDVDFQVWVDAGEIPSPRRVVLSYKHAPGQPQFRAEFSDWDFAPKASADLFSVTPPADAEQIPVLAPQTQPGGAQ